MARTRKQILQDKRTRNGMTRHEWADAFDAGYNPSVKQHRQARSKSSLSRPEECENELSAIAQRYDVRFSDEDWELVVYAFTRRMKCAMFDNKNKRLQGYENQEAL